MQFVVELFGALNVSPSFYIGELYQYSATKKKEVNSTNRSSTQSPSFMWEGNNIMCTLCLFLFLFFFSSYLCLKVLFSVCYYHYLELSNEEKKNASNNTLKYYIFMPMDCNEACISPLTVTCDSGLDVLNPTDVCNSWCRYRALSKIKSLSKWLLPKWYFLYMAHFVLGNKVTPYFLMKCLGCYFNS